MYILLSNKSVTLTEAKSTVVDFSESFPDNSIPCATIFMGAWPNTSWTNAIVTPVSGNNPKSISLNSMSTQSYKVYACLIYKLSTE